MCVHCIINNSYYNTQTIHDWILAVGVVVLLLIELTVSSVYTIVLRDKFIATLVPNAPDEVVEVSECMPIV